MPVIEGAGGVITNWQGNKISPSFDGTCLAAANIALHRQALEVIKNVKEVNEILGLPKAGEAPFEFNYLLLCNKVCGLSHYNMQMNIIVDEPESFNAWLSKQKTVRESMSAEVKTETNTLLAEKK